MPNLFPIANMSLIAYYCQRNSLGAANVDNAREAASATVDNGVVLQLGQHKAALCVYL